MAPYLDEAPTEPVKEALETQLKEKPQLIAPEPGWYNYALRSWNNLTTL